MNELEQRVEDITVPLDVAVIGCVVNGPGEAREADLGLAGGSPNHLVYIDGAPSQKQGNDSLVDDLERLIRAKAEQKKTQVAKEEANTIIKVDRKSTRLNSSHVAISYAVFCLKKKK